jgi:type VI secretion system (T6SS) effector TldE1-like protein
MIEGARVSRQFLAFNHRTLSLTLFPRTVPGASALAFSLLACAWALPRIPFGAPNVAQAPVVASASKAVANAAVANPFGAVLVDLRSRARSASAALARRAAPASKAEPFGSATLDLSVPAVPATPAARVAEIPPLPPRRSEELKSAANASPIPGISALRLGEASFENTPLPPRRSEEFASDAAPAADNAPRAPSVVQLGENAPEGLPVPPRRPDELSANQNPPPPVRLSAREAARQRRNGRTVVADAPPAADNRTFLEKLFGGAPQPQTSSPALGYAPAEGGVTTAARSVMSMSSPNARYDQFTAVYDISAHTVYLPNGTRLEAHSGLGSMLDDPRSVTQKMRGATPPTVYALTPREQLFHGVQALRLTPLGGNVYGRAGLLAHTFMLGPNGDSNGCVSFRNYRAFLQAYQNGEIRRLAVVASVN